MSLVVFPFKQEEVDVVATNLEVAARHTSVNEVWAVAASEGEAMSQVADAARSVSRAHATPVEVFAQHRIGSFRSGKGDGMNTAIALAAERGFDRTHFYDADITNFGPDWIDGAEEAADRGFGVVRHRFPRAATDAMITWMVTRPGLALLFPGTVLPRLGQPLGGELLLTLPATEALAGDEFVRSRSDWGVDTVLTHATSLLDLGIFEHNVPSGKRHALYGSLTDIRDMILECLDAVRSLRTRPTPPAGAVFEADPPAEVPADLKEVVGYDIDATRRSIAEPPTDEEKAILESLGVDTESPIEMSGEAWAVLYPEIMANFDLEDDGWRDAVFRLWVERVIHYTTHEVVHGYDSAIAYLEATIVSFEDSANRI